MRICHSREFGGEKKKSVYDASHGILSLGYGRRPFLVELVSVLMVLIICQLPGKPARTGWWWSVTPPLPATPTWKPLKGYEINAMGTWIKGKITRGFGSFSASLLPLMCGWKTPDLIPTNLILIPDAYPNVRNKGLCGVFKTSIFGLKMFSCTSLPRVSSRPCI